MENQTGRDKTFVDAHLPIDPQQQFREYTAPNRGATPTRPLPPTYTNPALYQRGNASQAGMPSNSGEAVTGIPSAYHPSQAGPIMSVPGYPPQVPGAWPGYPPYAGYPGQMGMPGQVPFYPGQAVGVPGQVPFYPGYQPYAPYAGYPGYGGYVWPMVPAQPKRDTYLLAVAIAAFVCSCLAILGGLGSLALMGFVGFAASLSSTLSGSTYFSSMFLLLTLAIAGIVGGGFCMYHSMRSLFFRKSSKTIWLPRFWVFLLCYIATIGVGFGLYTQGLDVSSPVLTGVLIYLGGIFPALTIMALGIRRLSFPRKNQSPGSGQRWTPAQLFRRQSASQTGQWPTSWRRLILALVSGATLSILLASILELVLELVLLGTQSGTLTQYISDPNSGNPPPSLFGLLLIMLSVIAPLVEEMVKPLAVVVLIGRVRSKAEAFTLGLACGIGFNLVETAGYISSGYNDWLNVALVRSGAGLLHGFGAAMVALGWYYLTHKEEGAWQRRTLLALGCAGYAVLQHALWNGSVGLMLIPGPIGNFFQNWSWGSGPFTLDGIELVNIVEVIAILIFFVYMAGRLRTGAGTKKSKRRGVQPTESPTLISTQGAI